MSSERRLLLTCEHGGRRVPPRFAPLLRGRSALLTSHRGWDPGALAIARALARATGAPLLAVTTTRLLVDPNRSPHNPRVFSELTRRLPAPERRALLERLHAPHWRRVRELIAQLREGGAGVLHVAVHSFVPELHGQLRDFEIGLLYDPARAPERGLAVAWQSRLKSAGLRVRRNAPYRGDSDGLTTALRRELGARAYAGIELELRQDLLLDTAQRSRLTRVLYEQLLAREVRSGRSGR